MLDRINLRNMLVLDIETVPQYASYSELPDNWKELWKKKMARDRRTAREAMSSHASTSGKRTGISCAAA